MVFTLTHSWSKPPQTVIEFDDSVAPETRNLVTTKLKEKLEKPTKNFLLVHYQNQAATVSYPHQWPMRLDRPRTIVNLDDMKLPDVVIDACNELRNEVSSTLQFNLDSDKNIRCSFQVPGIS